MIDNSSMWRIRGAYGEVLWTPESDEAAVTGRCCVPHNGNDEKNSDANQGEKDVAGVTEGCPAEKGYRLTEPDLMHGLLARMRWYS